jgi:hypothetical protein
MGVYVFVSALFLRGVLCTRKLREELAILTYHDILLVALLDAVSKI